MAPSAQPTPAPVAFDIPSHWYSQEKRQSDPPVCVTTCMGISNLGNCTAYTDYACLCDSAVYQQSVANCWFSSCNVTEIAYGQAYSAAGCAAFGVSITSTYVGSATGSSPSPTGDTTAAPVDTTIEPVTFSQTATNISAIMSAICGALFIAAIALGVQTVRARMRREEQMTQNRSWTAAGSGGQGDTKNAASRFGFSKNAQSSLAASRGQTNTYASDNFGMTSSNFGGSSLQFQPSRFGSTIGAGGTGFTNRMAVDEEHEGRVGNELKDE